MNKMRAIWQTQRLTIKKKTTKTIPIPNSTNLYENFRVILVLSFHVEPRTFSNPSHFNPSQIGENIENANASYSCLLVWKKMYLKTIDNFPVFFRFYT